MNFLILLFILFFLLLLLAVLKRWPVTHRQRILSYSTPPSWIQDLKNFFPAFERMNPKAQKLFIDRLKIHLAEVPCVALADCPVDTKKRLLALAPWCALTLNTTDPSRSLKRLMMLLPEEVKQFQPLIEEDELLVVWHEDQMRISIHPHYKENNILLKQLLSFNIKSSSWEELIYGNCVSEEIESLLGWRFKI